MDSTALSGFVGGLWDEQIVPQLTEYIRIPNKSPMFDAQWAEHGHMDSAVALMETWARAQPIPGMQIEVVSGLTEKDKVKNPNADLQATDGKGGAGGRAGGRPRRTG